MTAMEFYTPAEYEEDIADGFDAVPGPDDYDDWSFDDALKTAKAWAPTVINAGETIYSSPVTASWRKNNKGADAVVKGILGALKGVAGSKYFENKFDSDPFEPEYSSDEIDGMEAMNEEALAGDSTDSALAADEMVSRSFGVMRSAPTIRPIMSALSQQVRQIMMRARRDPRMHAMARVAPLALRRTAVTLMKMAAARRPISSGIGVRLFRVAMSQLMRSQRLRMAAVQRARARASRYQKHSGTYRPPHRNFGNVPGRRPVPQRRHLNYRSAQLGQF